MSDDLISRKAFMEYREKQKKWKKNQKRRNHMLKKRYGPCVSKERCLEILTEKVQDHLPKEQWKEYERAVNRVIFEFDKLDGAKPKFNKGKYIKDWYTCRNCGSGVNIEHNYCPNCGYVLQWNGIRCLTDLEG